MRDALKFVGGSITTYLAMAACSASHGGHSGASQSPGAGASGGAEMVATAGKTTGGVSSGGLGSAGMSAGNMGTGGMSNPDAGGVSNPDAGGMSNPDAGGVAGDLGTAGIGGIWDPVPDAAAEPAKDGTRLRAVYEVGEDSSKQFTGIWWDSQRNEECTFQLFSDGSRRCAPPVSVGWISVFSDAGCTNPLYATQTAVCPAGAAKYATTGQGWSACGTYSNAAVYALTPATPDKIFSGTPAACSDLTAAYKATYSFYTGTEVPLTSFAAATRQHG